MIDKRQPGTVVHLYSICLTDWSKLVESLVLINPDRCTGGAKITVAVSEVNDAPEARLAFAYSISLTILSGVWKQLQV